MTPVLWQIQEQWVYSCDLLLLWIPTLLQTPEEFESLYRARLETPQAIENNYTSTFVATVAYDALWTLALALNRTNEMVQSLTREEILRITLCNGTDDESNIVSLENFTYTNKLMGCIVRWNLESSDFVGVSVIVVCNHLLLLHKSAYYFNRVTLCLMTLAQGHILKS